MEIIEEAYERIGVDPRAGYDYKTARRSLNILLSDWANRGLNLWSVEEGVYPVIAGVADVTISAGIFDIMDAVWRDTTVTPPFDLNMERMSPTDFLSIPFKSMSGTPSRYLVRRATSGVSVVLWQVPSRNGSLVVNQLRASAEIVGYQNPMVLPTRFQNALISGLAYHLAMKRDRSLMGDMRAIYEADYEIAAAEDRDRSSFYFSPEVGR